MAKKAAEAAAAAQKVAAEAAAAAQKAAEDAAKAAAPVIDSVSKTVTDAAAAAQKAAKDAAKAAAPVIDSVSKTVTDTAASVQKAIDENETIKSVKATVGEVADQIGEAASAATSTIGQWADDFLGLIVIKLRELVGQIDFKQTIADVEKAGKEKSLDVAPMVKFLKQLQDFAANGQENK